MPLCPICDNTQRNTDACSDPFDALRSENAELLQKTQRLEDDLASLRSENAMLRKMQPVTLNGDAARSFALAAELSETTQELSALRADIQAGRLVRVPLPEDTVWAVREGKIESGKVVAPDGIWENFPDVVYSRWENGRLIYNCGTWQEQVFPTEQAARAAMEGDTE